MKAALLVCSLLVASAAKTCGPGKQLNGNRCSPCPLGTFKPSAGTAQCSKCQPGRFNDSPEAKTADACKVCPKGWFHPPSGKKAERQGAALVSKACEQCPSGQYQDKANQRVCLDCAPGTYYKNTERGPPAKREQDCKQCDLKKYRLKRNDQGGLIYGAATLDETCELKPIDCVMGAWEPWTRCSRVCGGGWQSATRKEVTPAKNGGKACPSHERTRRCNTKTCSNTDAYFPRASRLTNGKWWEFTYAGAWGPHSAECRYQLANAKATDPNHWENLQDVENFLSATEPLEPTGHPVDGWCCRITTKQHKSAGVTTCYGMGKQQAESGSLVVLGKTLRYDETTGELKTAQNALVANMRKILVHKRKCKHTKCSMEKHTCSTYPCNSRWFKAIGCPNKGYGKDEGRCDGREHFTMRVQHPAHMKNEDFDGHYCAVNHKLSPPECECYCLDAYKTLSKKTQAVPVGDELVNNIVSSHFNYKDQEGNAVHEHTYKAL